MSETRELGALFSDRMRLNLRTAAMSIAVAGFAFGCLVAPSAFAAPAPAPRAAAQTAPANPAEGFIQQNIDKGYQILNAKGVTEAQRRSQFHDFMMAIMDARRIGMFTLGQYANGVAKGDVDAFLATFADYTVAVYETRLNKYKDQVLKVTGSVARAADDVVVNCDATDPAHANDPPFKVAFRTRKSSDGKFVVTDLNIEGIWQTLSQRADFTGFLQQHGGRIADLTTDLKRQIQLLYTNT
jgi:phospholipid transport system substrate-binding protein